MSVSLILGSLTHMNDPVRLVALLCTPRTPCTPLEWTMSIDMIGPGILSRDQSDAADPRNE